MLHSRALPAPPPALCHLTSAGVTTSPEELFCVSCRTESKNPNHYNTKALEVRDISVNLQIFSKSINILCVGFISTVLSLGKKGRVKGKVLNRGKMGGTFPITTDGLTNCRESAGSWQVTPLTWRKPPKGFCHSLAGPQFPGHSFCCFGKEIKYSSCVESPKFSDLGKCRSTVSRGKALPGAQSWANPKSKLHLFHYKPPVSDMTLPQGRLHTTGRFCLKGKTQTSLETTFSEMLQI